MKYFLITTLLITTSLLVSAESDHYTSRIHGFAITPPTTAADATQIHQVATFSLPASNGFAPNVNIQHQLWVKSLEDYKALSEGQFKSLSWTVLSADVKNGEIIFAYTGSMQNRDFRWYARAIARPGKIYLITATALTSQWPTVGERLTASVNSFTPITP